MMTGEDEIRLGVIGCGGFGLFALQHFTQVPGVRLVGIAGTPRGRARAGGGTGCGVGGMAGTHGEAARAAAKRFCVPDVVEVEDLVARPDVDLVYVSTPPFL